MTTLHMETDTVRAMAGQLKQATEILRSHIQLLNSSAQSVDWLGPSRDEFVMETEGIVRQLESQAESGIALAGRVENEVTEWEGTSSSFGSAQFAIDLDKLRIGSGGVFQKPDNIFTLPGNPFAPESGFETLPQPISGDQYPDEVTLF